MAKHDNEIVCTAQLSSVQLMDKLVEYGKCLATPAYTELEKIYILETIEVIKNELSDRLEAKELT